MFIRRAKTRTTATGESYYTHRLVRAERNGDKVRQRTLLNLGRHFDVARADWPALCQRIEALRAGQQSLYAAGPPALETRARHIAEQLLAREGETHRESPPGRDVQAVDVASLALVRPRSVGVEHAALWAMEQTGLRALLRTLGLGPSLRAAAVRFTRHAQPGSLVTHPGVYCLRSNRTDWDEDTLWRTYFMLTEVEAVFRSLKSEPGLRPIYHHKPLRAEGRLFISVIAYQLVQVIRTRLKQTGEHASWTTLRRILEGQQRITATFRRDDGRTLHVRKATLAEPPQQALYEALGLSAAPGGVRKNIV